MTTNHLHTFHIPVMGIGFTIDTPIKVARFGISSVISIVDDEIIEQMREYHSNQYHENYTPIDHHTEDYRAKRITNYLNLVDKIVRQQIDALRMQAFETDNEIVKYFELLPQTSVVKNLYHEMMMSKDENQKKILQNELRKLIIPGSIDVNIMAKLDKINYDKQNNALPKEFSDASAALRGFANSTLEASVIFSAGYNPTLYNYIENFSDFFPDKNGIIKKKIILKVSDYRSALIQGKILAKKGLWVSEFRIESGLNCGGHAFATEGMLLGPILEEFKINRDKLKQELFTICNSSLKEKQRPLFLSPPTTRVTVQGGIGTSNEHNFLLEHYQTDATGWGSPFLLVPEATNLDETTLNQLATAETTDYYLSDISPLGVPFNYFSKSSSEQQRLERIEKGRPGSPCTKKCLCSNTEFTQNAICTASRKYQHLKIKALKALNLTKEKFQTEYSKITTKDCLCEGLCASAEIKYNIQSSKKNRPAITVCPGPNLAYFSGIFSLKQMIDHIYGRMNILNSVKRSNMFINELGMYVSYLQNELNKYIDNVGVSKAKYLNNFHKNLLEGINYYKHLTSQMKMETEKYVREMQEELSSLEFLLHQLRIPKLENK